MTLGDENFGFVCGDPNLYDAGARGVTFNVVTTDGSNERAKTVTYTLSKSVVQAATKRGSPQIHICFMAPFSQVKPFKVVDAKGKLDGIAPVRKVLVGSGEIDMYVGPLPTCNTKGISENQPCVLSSKGVAGGGREFVIRTPPGDPRITS
jgi:hypothetical protein